jgi:hypothetical protein
MANQEMTCVAARSEWQNCGAGGLGVRAVINLLRPLEPCRYVGFRANKPTSKLGQPLVQHRGLHALTGQ